MMKKVVAVALSALLLTAVLAGCAGNAQAETQKADVTNVTTDNAQNVVANSAAGAAPGGAQDGSGALNGDMGKSVMGEITQIDGSNITLKLAEMPDRQQNGQGGQKGDAKPSMDPNATPPQPGKDGGKGNGGPGMQLTYTGETQQITIPDGVTITKMENGGRLGGGPGGRGSNGQGQQEQGQQDGQTQGNGNGADRPNGTPNPGTVIALSDLKTGWILTIHYAQDGTTIESITAREPMTTQNNG